MEETRESIRNYVLFYYHYRINWFHIIIININMTNHIDYEQVQGRINKYKVRMQEGIPLTAQEADEYLHLQRQMHHHKHKERVEARRVNFRSIRRCLDQGVI